jgi:hypothetical protein
MIQVQANATVMMMVAKHDSVRELQPNFQFKADLEVPDTDSDPKDPTSPDVIEWNINWVCKSYVIIIVILNYYRLKLRKYGVVALEARE